MLQKPVRDTILWGSEPNEGRRPPRAGWPFEEFEAIRTRRRCPSRGSASNSGTHINSVTPANGTIPASLPVWLELVRDGSAYTGYYSLDGNFWFSMGSASVPGQADTQDAGMFVTSHATGSPAQVTVSGFSVAVNMSPIPRESVLRAGGPVTPGCLAQPVLPGGAHIGRIAFGLLPSSASHYGWRIPFLIPLVWAGMPGAGPGPCDRQRTLRRPRVQAPVPTSPRTLA